MGRIRDCYINTYITMKKSFTILASLFSCAGLASADHVFGNGSWEISEGVVINSAVDNDGNETGAGLVGGGSEVSGPGGTSELASSSLKISGATVYGIAMGGSYAKDGAAAEITGNSSVEMNSGNVLYKDPNTSPYDALVMGGSFAYTTSADSASTQISGDTSVTVNGGYAYYAAAGSAAQNEVGSATSVVSGKSSLILNGGTIDYGAYGSGWALGDKARVENLAGSHVEINSGASVTWNVFGAGGAWGKGTSVVEGGTKVVIDGGTVGGSVLGGGEAQGQSTSIVTGGTDVQMKGGYAKYLYGGGANWDLADRSTEVSVDTAKVSISGGEVGSYVAGGGYYSDVKGLAVVEVSGGTVNGNIYGAGEGNGSTGSTLVNVTGGTLKAKVYGGGVSNAVVEGDTNVNISGNVSVSEVYGGGLNGAVINGKTNVRIDNASVYYVMGGSYGDSEIKKGTDVFVDNASVNTVYGAGWAENGASEKISGGTNVHIGANVAFADAASAAVYGGGWASGNGSSSEINGNTNVVVDSGTPLSAFGGGSVGDNAVSRINGDSSLTINGGKIWTANGGNYIYGSGQTATNGNASVIINGGEVSQVYGGSWANASSGASSDTITGNTYVKISGGKITADFAGDGNVFGGSIAESGATAAVNGSANIEISGDAYVSQDVYGGGSGAGSVVNGDANITISGNASVAGSIYGGGRDGAAVNGFKTLNIGSESAAYTGASSFAVSGFDAINVNSGSSAAFRGALVLGAEGQAKAMNISEGSSVKADGITINSDGSLFVTLGKSGVIDSAVVNNGLFAVAAGSNLEAGQYSVATSVEGNAVKAYGGKFENNVFTVEAAKQMSIDEAGAPIAVVDNGIVSLSSEGVAKIDMSFNSASATVNEVRTMTSSLAEQIGSDFKDMAAYAFDVEMGGGDTVVLSFFVNDSSLNLSDFAIWHKSEGDSWERAEDDITNLSYDGKTLSFVVSHFSEYGYSAVPEPAACAAVFGALALAFAAWRRRR